MTPIEIKKELININNLLISGLYTKGEISKLIHDLMLRLT